MRNLGSELTIHARCHDRCAIKWLPQIEEGLGSRRRHVTGREGTLRDVMTAPCWGRTGILQIPGAIIDLIWNQATMYGPMVGDILRGDQVGTHGSPLPPVGR